MDFESGDAARALWPKIENTINPLYPDDKSDGSPDQGPASSMTQRSVWRPESLSRFDSPEVTDVLPACSTSTLRWQVKSLPE